MVSLGSEGTRFALSLAEVTEGEAKAERGSPVTPGAAACNLLLTSTPTYRLYPMNGTDRGLDSVDQLAALQSLSRKGVGTQSREWGRQCSWPLLLSRRS